MESKTVTIDGDEVLVEQTEDGYRAEKQISKDEAIEQFVGDHPSLLENTLRRGPVADGTGHVNYSVDGRQPRKSNIGGNRTNAEDALTNAGYRFDIKSIEELGTGTGTGFDGDLSIHFDVVEIDDEP